MADEEKNETTEEPGEEAVADEEAARTPEGDAETTRRGAAEPEAAAEPEPGCVRAGGCRRAG